MANFFVAAAVRINNAVCKKVSVKAERSCCCAEPHLEDGCKKGKGSDGHTLEKKKSLYFGARLSFNVFRGKVGGMDVASAQRCRCSGPDVQVEVQHTVIFYPSLEVTVTATVMPRHISPRTLRASPVRQPPSWANVKWAEVIIDNIPTHAVSVLGQSLFPLVANCALCFQLLFSLIPLSPCQ